MNDPFAVLDLPGDADEATIRRRYLELVRKHPPERDPEQFARIRAAYDEARDPARRLEAMLFRGASTDSVEAIAADLRARLREHLARLPVDAILALAESP